MSYSYKIIIFVFSIFAFIHADGQLVADFTISTSTYHCVPLVVNFTSTSTGSPDSTLWDFGNGAHSVFSSTSTTYTSATTFTITLKVKKGSSFSIKTATITVYDTPYVNFSATPTRGCAPLTVTFTDGSTLNAPGSGTYSWDFGDGNSGSGLTSSNTYTPGYYPVTLVVTNSNGCRSSATKASYIHALDHPTAGFSARNTHFCKPIAADTFDNSSYGTNPLTYLWRFGDGSPTSSSTSPGHNYITTGDFNVTLVVTDSNGCKDSLVRPNYVHVHKPTANFTPSRLSACLYDTICFSNTSTGSYTTTVWTFADGTIDYNNSPCHTFTDTGNRDIRLIISDGYCNDTITKTVHILPLPKVNFGFTPKYPCPAPQTISFFDSTPGATSWSWDFGDGSSPSHVKNPTHYYTSNGQYTVVLTATNGSGCSGSDTETLTIADMYVHILADRYQGCVPLTVNFSENVLTSIPFPGLYPFPVTYYWTFGDGGTSTNALQTHTYYSVGIYTVHLTVTNPNGCTATDSTQIRVGNPPVAAFHPARDTTCPLVTLNFYNTSTGSDSSRWLFGDGGQDNGFNTSHIYTDTGLFKVTLIAFFHGCADTIIHYEYVLPPIPVISNSPPCPPNSRYTYAFYDTNSVLMTTHEWYFGDGDSSFADNPVHTYGSLGNYQVILVAHNSSSGCTDSTAYTVNVINPTLSIRALTDTDVCRDQYIALRADMSGSLFNGGNRWMDSANGKLVNTYGYPQYIAIGDSAIWRSDTMKVIGWHSIWMTGEDMNKCNIITTRDSFLVVAKPIAGFKGIPVIGCAPLTVAFTDTSKHVTGTFATTHAWTFGDGGASTVTTASTNYTYNTKGTYTVKLITTDNIGCKDTLQKTDYITALKPSASFTASITTPCIGDSIQWYNASSIDTAHDTLYSISWDFGDGKTSSAFSPRHAYAGAGTYTIRLIIQDVHGCRDTMTRNSYITVTKPHAAFGMDDSISICPPLIVHFSNTSTSATAFAWDFDDGGTSVLTNPSHTFTFSKYYKVRLIATDNNGCSDTAYEHVNIYGYAGGLKYFPLLGCVPLTVNFVASITSAPTILWDFSDGVTATATGGTTTTHTYETPGAYVPKLILGDGKGCNSASIGLDTIKVDAVIAGLWAKTPCEKDTVHFTDTSKTYFSPVVKWLWSFDGGTSYTSEHNPAKYYDTTGTYPVYLLVINGNGCRDSVSTTFTILPPPNISAGPDTVICVHDTAILTPSGGVSYLWSSSAFLSCNACTNPKIAPTDTSYYYVLGFDQYGCKNVSSVKVGLKIKTTGFVDDPPAICQGEGTHLRAYGAQHYVWSPADALDSPMIATPFASPMDTVNYMMIATEGSCIPDTQFVTLIVHVKPSVNAGPDQTIISGQTAQLQGRGVHVDTYLWTPAQTLSCSTCLNPVSSTLVTTDYALIGTSQYGCKDTDTVRVIVLCDKSQVFIPNAFTPNGDGQNDLFFPRGVAINNVKSFRIYNRWGELVFEKINININDESNGWDGTFRGVKQDPGVYMYMMDAICETGEEIFWKGDVTIIR